MTTLHNTRSPLVPEQTDAPLRRTLVNGKWVEAHTGGTIEVENPAHRGSVIGRVPRADSTDVDIAVRAAAEAFTTWKLVAPRDRGRLLQRIADDLDADLEEMARLIASEIGNALRPQARPEARSSADTMRYFGGLASELKGEVIPLGEQVLSYTRREPIGVVGAIVPWNAPLLLSTLKIAMSITAGNTLVLKAAEDAPLAVLRLAEICARYLPDGVLNVLTGYGEEAGAALAVHPLVSKLSFTGSTEVGKSIMHAAADRIVPVSLELGARARSSSFPTWPEQNLVVDTLDRLPTFAPTAADRERAALGRIRIDGLVAHPAELTTADLSRLHRAILEEAFLCDEGWTVPGLRWGGVRLSDVLALAEPLSSAHYVRAASGKWVVPIALVDAPRGVVCDELNDEPLTVEHGAPWRLVVSGGPCYTNVKWLEQLELVAESGEDDARGIAVNRLT